MADTSANVDVYSARGSAYSGLFLRRRFYLAWGLAVLVIACGNAWSPLLWVGLALLGLVVLAAIVEYIVLSRLGKQLFAGRKVEDQLSLGDDNPVTVAIDNQSNLSLGMTLLDELPLQLQEREFGTEVEVPPKTERQVRYQMRPLERGVYSFGALYLFVYTRLALVQRRYAFGPERTEVAVYPSVLQMRKQALRVRQLMRRQGSNIRQRRFGRSYEFDQIKNYVPGDDYRQLNWKATARTGDLMLNTYEEERSQQIVALVDSSRTMLSPFDGLSLLDYAINSTLALLNVALLRGDRVGLLGFDRQVHTHVPTAARPEHLRRILEMLYRQKSTDFEPDYGALYQHVRRNVRGRSLLLMYTNFETLVSLERNLPVLRQLARMHLLVVVMFVNREVGAELYHEPTTIKDAYLHTIAAEHDATQARIAATLAQAGIIVMRTTPQELTADAVSQYLEIKKGGRL